MPKGKNGNAVTTRRSIAFKVRNHESDAALLLKKNIEERTRFASSIHRVMALCLGICDEERTAVELQWLKENFPEFHDNFLLTEALFTKAELQSAVFLICQFGAQAKDAFYAFSLEGKKPDSLLKGIQALKDSYTGYWKLDKDGKPVIKDGEKVWVKGLIEKACEAYQKTFSELDEGLFQNRPHDETTMELEADLGRIGQAEAFLEQILNGEKKLPFAWIKELVDSTYKSAEGKLIIEAAFQRLLGYLNSARTYRKECFKLKLDEFILANTDQTYQRFLGFVQEHEDIIHAISSTEPRYERWKGYRNSDVLKWAGEESSLEALEKLERDDLLKISGIEDFDRCIKLYLKFKKGEGDPTGLTFIDIDKHPFDFTIPGEMTKKDGYQVIELPKGKKPGLIQIKLDNGDKVLLEFFSRELRDELFEKRKTSGKFPYLYRVSLARDGSGSSTFPAALGGLRIRPRKYGLFLDLTVNVVCPDAPFIPWNKDGKHFDVSAGMVLASVTFGINGEIYVRKMKKLPDGTLKHLKTIPVQIESFQYENLAPVMVTEGAKVRRAEKGEFGRLLHLLGQNYELPPWELCGTLNEKMSIMIDEINSQRNSSRTHLPHIQIDSDNTELLLRHFEKRNDRTGRQENGINVHQSGSLGRLHELHLTILRLKRELMNISTRIKEIRAENPDDSNLKDMQKKKIRLLKDIKQMRRHQLKVRDVRVRSFSHAIMKSALSSEKEHGGASAHIIVLPQIKDKDPNRKAGKSRWNKLQNTLLLAGRSADIAEKLEELSALFGLSALRVNTYMVDLVCPRCRTLGVHYWKKGSEINFRQEIQRKDGEALPLPILPSFGCSSGCFREVNVSHLSGGEMISRICFGGEIQKSPIKPQEQRNALLKLLGR
ncbi:MAG TPA: hypothetical protein PKA63_08610 [Oligoflexia bacterium]|nr:hypothetical protein [Oligoflexia bacterium]HMP48712.1 hypothetical protein [Oligoflexia bacterium]